MSVKSKPTVSATLKRRMAAQKKRRDEFPDKAATHLLLKRGIQVGISVVDLAELTGLTSRDYIYTHFKDIRPGAHFGLPYETREAVESDMIASRKKRKAGRPSARETADLYFEAKEAGMTPQDIADHIGVTRNMLYSMKRAD